MQNIIDDFTQDLRDFESRAAPRCEEDLCSHRQWSPVSSKPMPMPVAVGYRVSCIIASCIVPYAVEEETINQPSGNPEASEGATRIGKIKRCS